MKIFRKIVVLSLGSSLIAFAALARGINDGTLPLKLNGTAQEQAPREGNPITAAVHITNARPEQDGTNSVVACEVQTNNLKYVAGGTIKVGTRSYAISGICANEADDSIEVIGRSNNAIVRITGVLSQQRQTTEIEGRLKIVGSNQLQNRFLIRVSKWN